MWGSIQEQNTKEIFSHCLLTVNLTSVINYYYECSHYIYNNNQIFWRDSPLLGWHRRQTKVMLLDLALSNYSTAWMKSTALHPLCTAGKMTHIHTLLKKENFLFYEIPLCRLYQVLPSEHFQPYFSFFLSIVPLLILYNLRRHFEFLLVIFSYLMQSGIWNTSLSHIFTPSHVISHAFHWLQ